MKHTTYSVIRMMKSGGWVTLVNKVGSADDALAELAALATPAGSEIRIEIETTEIVRETITPEQLMVRVSK